MWNRTWELKERVELEGLLVELGLIWVETRMAMNIIIFLFTEKTLTRGESYLFLLSEW